MADISLFIGGIRPLPLSGRPTGMYKSAVQTTLQLGHEGFVGDQQADRRVHGGPEKAVHLYPAGHYAILSKRFPEATEQLVPGSLGENISTGELDETAVRIGDIWQLGTARLQVCQPRNPCWKIDERFGCDGMAAHIAEHRLTGWYWRVLTSGWVQPGDPLQLEAAANHSMTLADAMQLWQVHRPAIAALEALSAAPGIALHWQQKIDARVAWLRQNTDTDIPLPRFHVKPEQA